MSKKILLIVAGLLMIALFFRFRSFSPKKNQQIAAVNQENIIADKIEIVHFHGTQQCWSCVTVGDYALKTIKEKFPEEYKSGKITYQDVNSELTENQELVKKYQSRGSSVFFNIITDDQDHIIEDVTVWRLVNNESRFIEYFAGKLNSYLGK